MYIDRTATSLSTKHLARASLLRPLTCACFVIATAAAPAYAGAKTPSSGRSALLEGDATPEVHVALTQAEAARGLSLEQGVLVRGLSRAEIRDEFLTIFEEDLDRVLVDGSERLAHFLELLPPDDDLLGVYLNMLHEEVLGYYRPNERELVLVELEDTASFAAIAGYRTTVVHELLHALQDDAFDLEAYRMHEVAVGDASIARVAVVEGDAVFHMNAGGDPTDPVAAAQDVTMQLSLRRPRGAWRIAMRAVNPDHNPYIYRSVLFPYVFGMPFIAAVQEARGMEGVDALFESDVPLSSEQILHPERYLAGDQPTWLEATLRDGFCARRHHTSVNGEFELRNLLATMSNMTVFDDYIDVAVDGWDGDRLDYWTECGAARLGETMTLVTVWDSVADAREFADAASSVFSLWLYPEHGKAVDDAPLRSDERTSEDGGSSYILHRVGDRVVVVDQWYDQVSVALLSDTGESDEDVERLVGELALSLRRYRYPEPLVEGSSR